MNSLQGKYIHSLWLFIRALFSFDFTAKFSLSFLFGPLTIRDFKLDVQYTGGFSI